MTMFYRLLADPKAVKRWYLKAPLDASGNELDARVFTQGLRYLGALPLMIPLRRYGDLVDFNFGDFDMVVTPAKINAEIERQLGPQVQRISVEIESGNKDFEILNVLDVVRCIDKQSSEFTIWTENDGRPDKTGQFRMITQLRIDANAAEGHCLFRIAEWPITLIASEDIKKILESNVTTGVAFEPVNS